MSGTGASGRLACVALVVALSLPAGASAQSSATSATVPAAVPARAPVVLVLDTGSARVDASALFAALMSSLARPVVRITDVRARDAAGTLTVAAGTGRRWLVRYDAGGHHATRTRVVERPALLLGGISELAQTVISELEASPPAPAAEFAYLLWDDEILDPFAGLPRPPRREVAIVSEVLDPFAPAALRQRDPWAEVIDPWSGETP